ARPAKACPSPQLGWVVDRTGRGKVEGKVTELALAVEPSRVRAHAQVTVQEVQAVTDRQVESMRLLAGNVGEAIVEYGDDVRGIVCGSGVVGERIRKREQSVLLGEAGIARYEGRVDGIAQGLGQDRDRAH